MCFQKKKKEKTVCIKQPLEIGFLKVLLVLNCFSVTTPRTLLEGVCLSQPSRPCEFELPAGAGIQVVSMGNARQHYFLPHWGSLGNLGCR